MQAATVTTDNCLDVLVATLQRFPADAALVERALTALFVTPGVPAVLVQKGVVPLALAALKDHGSNAVVR